MAEAFLNRTGEDLFQGESAGLEPGILNPVVVAVMKEEGIDISGNKTKSVEDILESGKEYKYVITVCDEARAERCPVFPGKGKKLHWGFEDPSSLSGNNEDKLEHTRIIRDQIKDKISEFINENKKQEG